MRQEESSSDAAAPVEDKTDPGDAMEEEAAEEVDVEDAEDEDASSEAEEEQEEQTEEETVKDDAEEGRTVFIRDLGLEVTPHDLRKTLGALLPADCKILSAYIVKGTRPLLQCADV